MPANVGDIKAMGSFPGSARSPGGGHGNPLQYSCFEIPMGYSQEDHKESDMTEVMSMCTSSII